MKRGLSILLSIGIVLLSWMTTPSSVYAESHTLNDGDHLNIATGVVTKADDSSETLTLGAGDTISVTSGAEVVITGTKANLYIDCGAGATLTLDSVVIINTALASGAAPLKFNGSGNKLILEGESTLKSYALSYAATYVLPAVDVTGSAVLTIEGTGKLLAAGGGDVNYGGAGIGGGKNQNAGTIIINGGDITAEGGYHSAGIGAGENATGDSVKITINGGTVHATGGNRAAGIGGGNGTDESTGGSNGGTITINGGEVTAKAGTYGAGIGGGNIGSSGTIKIYGGTITSEGITAYGSGIGAGNRGNVETIEIHGGTIAATAAEGAAGIGAGFYGAGGSISISGGNITATTGNNGSGIGGGMMNGNCGNINISGGTIEATGVGTGAGIGCGGGVPVSSGVITVSGMPRIYAAGTNTNLSATLTKISGSGFICMRSSMITGSVDTSSHAQDNSLDIDAGASTINGYSVPSSWTGKTNSGYFIATGGPRQVTFEENGGTAVDDLGVVDGSKLTPPDSTKAGYDLADWYLDSDFNTLWNFDSDTVDSDITLYAKWLKADLSSNLLIDNDSSGELVGTIGTSSGGLTLTLSDSGTYLDNQYFTTNGNRLVFSGTADINEKSTYTIKITITTAGGVTKSEVYTITVKGDGNNNGGSTNPDSYTLTKNSNIESNPMENDEFSTSGSTWSGHWIIRQPSHGSAEIGSIIYTPDKDYIGSDSLTYMACDNANYCMRGSVSYTVGSGSGSGGGSGSGSGSSSAGDVLPYTGFPVGSVTELAVQPADASYLETEMQLEIPALDVLIPIVGVPGTESGWNVTWLGEKAGYLEGTAFPTWKGNTVLTAHNYKSDGLPGPFNKLETLNYGDLITIHAWHQDYIYEVRTRDIVNSDDTSLLNTSEYDMITLITCKNYDESSGSYLNRVAVQAVLVDIEPIE